ncbi:MAG: hypothetical protein JW779_14895 [Candidatus Thorarchaeota archaeon]|nr:hypothetical protein [Candidatus Thorarchaeota archaeon]
MVKKSVWIATGAGLLTTVAALIIQVNYITLQTEPTLVNSVVSGASAILLITGAVLFSEAIWDLKQKINRAPVIMLIAIGLIGISGILVFHNIFVAVFFPRLSIISFLLIDFMVVALTGIFLSIFSQLHLSNDK